MQVWAGVLVEIALLAKVAMFQWTNAEMPYLPPLAHASCRGAGSGSGPRAGVGAGAGAGGPGRTIADVALAIRCGVSRVGVAPFSQQHRDAVGQASVCGRGPGWYELKVKARQVALPQQASRQASAESAWK